jgi:hypothetical protein
MSACATDATMVRNSTSKSITVVQGRCSARYTGYTYIWLPIMSMACTTLTADHVRHICWNLATGCGPALLCPNLSLALIQAHVKSCRQSCCASQTVWPSCRQESPVWQLSGLIGLQTPRETCFRRCWSGAVSV